jgi:hypothetical protein
MQGCVWHYTYYEQNENYIEFEAFTVVIMKNAVFWDVAPYPRNAPYPRRWHASKRELSLDFSDMDTWKEAILGSASKGLHMQKTSNMHTMYAVSIRYEDKRKECGRKRLWPIQGAVVQHPQHKPQAIEPQCISCLMHRSWEWEFLTMGPLAAKQKQHTTANTTFTRIIPSTACIMR